MKRLLAFGSRVDERVRHVVVAAAITLALAFATILELPDKLGWITQSRIAEREASGEIVFVAAREDVTDPAYPQRRVALAQAMREAAAQGADRIFLDIVIDEPSTPSADRELAEAIEELGDRVVLVERHLSDLDSVDRVHAPLASIAGDARLVPSKREIDFLGFTWVQPFLVVEGSVAATSLPAVLASVEGKEGNFPVDYGIAPSSIPVVSLTDIALPRQAGEIELYGKSVLIGEAWRNSSQIANIPGHLEVPASVVSILGAETLAAGRTGSIGPVFVLLIATLALLTLVLLLQDQRKRRIGYCFLAVAPFVALLVFAYLGVRASLSAALMLLAIYALQRLRVKWQQRFALFDQDTGLATFRALERDLSGRADAPPLVIAKIHGYDDVMKVLPKEQHAEYVVRVVDRLKVTQSGLPIYNGEGRYLAWMPEEMSPASLASHLEGLRALFSHPLLFGETEIDVGITFGADFSSGSAAPARIASGLAAVEQTSEAHSPIHFDKLGSSRDDLWSISLQARIDAAMVNGEIFMAYQPKVETISGRLVGVESLVRWHDPERGDISPTYFISQCEKAGRMDHLTRFVLRSATTAGKKFIDAGLDITVSVNISATLLRDSRVEIMVMDALARSGLAPANLILEITETSRIADLDSASSVLTSLRARGVRLSIDDFGMGAASAETLFRLPFDELKIDRLFVKNLPEKKAKAIVGSLIQLGRSAGIAVVAEGVESFEILTELREMGCPYAQGYVIAKPLPEVEIVEFQRDGVKMIN